jgi:hypothetical protein
MENLQFSMAVTIRSKEDGSIQRCWAIVADDVLSGRPSGVNMNYIEVSRSINVSVITEEPALALHLK